MPTEPEYGLPEYYDYSASGNQNNSSENSTFWDWLMGLFT